MSFSGEEVVYYLVDQFYYNLLIGYIKMATMLIRQPLKNDENNVMEPRVSKCHGVDERDDEERNNSLDEYEGEIDNARYISLSFIAFLSLP